MPNGYCKDNLKEKLKNLTMEAECNKFDEKCSACYKKEFFTGCVKVCGSGNTCPETTPDICKKPKYENCTKCYEDSEKCLLCPEGLESIVFANHTKSC